MAAVVTDKDAIDLPMGISDKEVQLFQAIADARESASKDQDYIRQYVIDNFPMEDLWMILQGDGQITEETILNAKSFLEEWVTNNLAPEVLATSEKYIDHAENILAQAERI